MEFWWSLYYIEVEALMQKFGGGCLPHLSERARIIATLV